MEETIPFKREKTHFTSQYSCQFTNQFHISIYHYNNYKIEIREYSKGFFFMGRRGLRELNSLSQLVFHLQGKAHAKKDQMFTLS